jgi:DNA helicase-2/ATP-dependent DNA helicase PcrA
MKENSIEDKSVHCFLLVNKIVAEHAGLAELYDWFNATPFYKQNYDILATELLSNDVNKLGEIERYLYNLTEFFFLCQNDDTPLLDIISRELLVSLDIESVAKIVDALKKMTAISLKEIILAIETFKNDISRDLHEKKSKLLIDKAVDSITGIENFSMDNFVEIVKREIFQEDVTAVEQIETLLNLDKEIFYRWYLYINRHYEEDIIYHTFHSTKGLEYDNVVMVFGDSFGRSKSYFNNYFAGYNQELKDNQLELYRKARNLLYVAATRARLNLRILYTGDYQSKKEIFDIIFGKVDLWKKEDKGDLNGRG